MATPIAPYLPTGIHVVIVGAGFGGLTASIEAMLKGHTVSVLEKAPRWEQHGDIISISELKPLYPPISLPPSSPRLHEPEGGGKKRENPN